MKTCLVAVASFVLGIFGTYFYFSYIFAAMTQHSTQGDVHRDAALVEHLALGNHDHVREVLLLSLCANREYLREQSESLLWQDRGVSDRFIESTSQHCVNEGNPPISS